MGTPLLGRDKYDSRARDWCPCNRFCTHVYKCVDIEWERERVSERERKLLQTRSINTSDEFDPLRLTAAINIRASLPCLPTSRTTSHGGGQASVCVSVCARVCTLICWHKEIGLHQTFCLQAAEKWSQRSRMFHSRNLHLLSAHCCFSNQSTLMFYVVFSTGIDRPCSASLCLLLLLWNDSY